MLQELDWYLGNEFDDDVIARGAIVLVRFPSLASELLSAPVLPGEFGDVDTGETDESKALSEMWARPDVTSVVGNVTARQLARCFGREAVAEAETERTGKGDSASSTESLPHHATDDCDDANDAGGHA